MANQVRTFTQLQAAVTHVLAGAPNVNNPAGAIVNMALNWVTMKRAWAWRNKPLTITVSQVNLVSPGGLSIWAFDPTTNANVTGSAAWATAGYPPIYRDNIGLAWVYSVNHGMTPGLYFQLQGVTQTKSDPYPFNGFYVVNTVPDANTFTFSNPGQSIAVPQDITAPATGTPPYGSYVQGQSALPSDFASMVSLRAAPQSIRRITPTTLDAIMEMRQLAFGSTFEMFYAVSYLPQSAPNLEPTPTIHFFPVPTIATPSFLQGFYLRRVPILVSGTDIPDVPSQFQDLVYFASRAFAKSTEEDQIGTDWQMVNSMLPELESEDGITQQPGGQMQSNVRFGSGEMFNPSFFPGGNIGAK